MNSRLLSAISLSILGVLSTAASAALIDNGGGLIYDDVLDITWSQPDTAAGRSWYDAHAWAEGLTLGGVGEWRLPYVSVAAGVGPIPFGSSPVDCITASEVDCRDNELGYMYYHNLGGTFGSSFLSSGDPDLALFPMLSPTDYWTDTDYYLAGWAYNYNYNLGGHGASEKFRDEEYRHAWAVHAGNVSTVPVPAAAWLFGSGLLWLFGSGLLGLTGVSRRKKTA